MDSIPWHGTDGTAADQQPMPIPQDLYEHLMSLPPGTDVTEYFEFEPAWNLTVTTTGEAVNDECPEHHMPRHECGCTR